MVNTHGGFPDLRWLRGYEWAGEGGGDSMGKTHTADPREHHWRAMLA